MGEECRRPSGVQEYGRLFRHDGPVYHRADRSGYCLGSIDRAQKQTLTGGSERHCLVRISVQLSETIS